MKTTNGPTIAPGTIVVLRSDKARTPRRWEVLGQGTDGYYRLVREGKTPNPYTRHSARPDNLQKVDTP